jgi:rod shape-determining protein MreD
MNASCHPSVLFAVLATAVPWGLPPDATFILPLVVVMMVFCWRVIPGSDLQPYVAMLLGLLTDVMSGGPLGFWALMTLTGAIAGGLTSPLSDGQDMKRLWLVWAAVAVLVASLGWLIASLYFCMDRIVADLSVRSSVRALPVVLQPVIKRPAPGRRIIYGVDETVARRQGAESRSSFAPLRAGADRRRAGGALGSVWRLRQCRSTLRIPAVVDENHDHAVGGARTRSISTASRWSPDEENFASSSCRPSFSDARGGRRA